MTTDDSFDKVYAWYQQHMPAGAEKSTSRRRFRAPSFPLGRQTT